MKILLSLLLILTAIMCFCCGGCPASRQEVKKKIDNADVLWDSGKKADAVMEYRRVYEDSLSDEKARMLPRIVEFEVNAGNTDEAKKWIKRGLDDKLKIEYTDPAAKKVFAVAKKEYDEAAAEKERRELEAKAQTEREAAGRAMKERFVGRWRIDAREGVFYMTLESSFEATKTNSGAKNGKWEIIGDEARIIWSDGWRNIINAQNGTTTAFKPGTDWNSPPFSTVPAIKVPPPSVTRANYNKIKIGMSLDEVQAILGPGEENARGEGVLIATWQSKAGFLELPTVITITFQNGRVESKAIAP